VSRPGEGEAEFRARLRAEGRAARDVALAKLRERYAPKLARLKERIAAAEQRSDRERDEYSEKKLQSAISIGTSLVGALFGRKLASATNVGRAGTAARSVSRAAREREDIARADERVEDLRAELAELEAQLAGDTGALEAGAGDPAVTKLEIAPRKSDLDVERIQLVWLPWWQTQDGQATALFSL
jgi:phage host-nuclease inhibitor protein Gam